MLLLPQQGSSEQQQPVFIHYPLHQECRSCLSSAPIYCRRWAKPSMSSQICFLSLSIDCVVLFHNHHWVSVISALTLEVSSDTAQELPALQPSPCWKTENCCGEPGTHKSSAPKVLLRQDSLRFWRILKRMMKQGQNTALHKVEIKCICPQKEHKKLWVSMPWQAENEQPEAIHVQRAANTAKQQLSTSFCSLSMTNSSWDFPLPKKERGNFF